MKTQIEEALSRPVCTGWDRGFLESILNQLERNRQLSDKQMVTVRKVVDRNGTSAQTLHDEWESVYAKEHKEEAMVLARYYASTGYFTELVQDIQAGVVPDMRAYTKMRGNKYATQVLETHHAQPKYSVGTFVVARANCLTSNVSIEKASTTYYIQQLEAAKAFRSKGGIILAVTDRIRTHAKGSKTYKILPIGSTITVFVEERHIKLKRK